MTRAHAPLARHLSRFSLVPASSADANATMDLAPAVPPARGEPTLEITVSALEARLDAACSAVRTQMEAEHAAVSARLAADGAEALDKAVAEALAARDLRDGAAVAAQITAALDTLHHALALQVADAVRPLLKDAVAARVASAIADALAQALGDPSGVALVVRGPAALLAPVEAQLAAGAAVTFVRDETDAEIAVKGGDICVRSRLAEALAALAAGA